MIMPVLAVKSVEASVKYYTEILSFQHMMSMPGVGGVLEYGVVTLGTGINIALSRQANLEARGNGVVLTLYLSDEMDIDEYFESCVAQGATITREIADEYWGDRTFLVKDPDGFVLQIAKSMSDLGEDEFSAVAK